MTVIVIVISQNWNFFKNIGFLKAFNERISEWACFYPFKPQPHKMVKHSQIIRRLLPTNCLSVIDHFVGLALKELHLVKRFQRYLNFVAQKKEKFSRQDLEETYIYRMAPKRVFLMGFWRVFFDRFFCSFLGLNHNVARNFPHVENNTTYFMQNFKQLNMKKFFNRKTI